ncbi:uncharacterized protein EI90DRAFT_3291386 [Cantharellus anzutake]|uniref:uncharacterized protein n=1 Tax=Cantharellus anzutake TaxID=1750568 RepID=UPI001908A7DB|nr:uncharacterized protein EI90DRAFT_3291386 [Cantharellus anzutake]KAF8326321.1 hypothetical protein EI90DRAFT_3291386 [Cantharellus anzutake]
MPVNQGVVSATIAAAVDMTQIDYQFLNHETDPPEMPPIKIQSPERDPINKLAGTAWLGTTRTEIANRSSPSEAPAQLQFAANLCFSLLAPLNQFIFKSPNYVCGPGFVAAVPAQIIPSPRVHYSSCRQFLGMAAWVKIATAKGSIQFVGKSIQFCE